MHRWLGLSKRSKIAAACSSRPYIDLTAVVGASRFDKNSQIARLLSREISAMTTVVDIRCSATLKFGKTQTRFYTTPVADDRVMISDHFIGFGALLLKHC